MVRSRVLEHRIDKVFYGKMLRFWVESHPSPNFGGIEDPEEADRILEETVVKGYEHFKNVINDMPTAKQVVEFFLESVPAVNAVEWAPGSKPGAVAYRDWP